MLPGARLRVTLKIDLEIPAGAPEDVVRTVTENSRASRFDQQGFESEQPARAGLEPAKALERLTGSPDSAEGICAAYLRRAGRKYSVPRMGRFSWSRRSSKSSPRPVKSRLRVSTTRSGERL